MWFYYLHSSSVCIFSLILMSKLEISNESWIIQERRVAIDRRISERKHCAQQEHLKFGKIPSWQSSITNRFPVCDYDHDELAFLINLHESIES